MSNWYLETVISDALVSSKKRRQKKNIFIHYSIVLYSFAKFNNKDPFISFSPVESNYDLRKRSTAIMFIVSLCGSNAYHISCS